MSPFKAKINKIDKHEIRKRILSEKRFKGCATAILLDVTAMDEQDGIKSCLAKDKRVLIYTAPDDARIMKQSYVCTMFIASQALVISQRTLFEQTWK